MGAVLLAWGFYSKMYCVVILHAGHAKVNEVHLGHHDGGGASSTEPNTPTYTWLLPSTFQVDLTETNGLRSSDVTFNDSCYHLKLWNPQMKILRSRKWHMYLTSGTLIFLFLTVAARASFSIPWLCQLCLTHPSSPWVFSHHQRKPIFDTCQSSSHVTYRVRDLRLICVPLFNFKSIPYFIKYYTMQNISKITDQTS